MTRTPSLSKSPGVDDWIAIDADGGVTVRTGKVEIGQRITTAIAVVAADALDVDFQRVRVAPADTDGAPDEGYTSGSNSMEQSGTAVRLAAATARRRLLELAAEALGVDASTLETDAGLVRSRATNQSLSYAELIGGRAFGVPVDADADAHPAPGRRRVGAAVEPHGLRDVVTGAARFVQDLSPPGVLHARVVRPPHYHARLARVPEGVESRLRGASVNARLRGATLIRDGSFLAVAHADEHAAVRAAATLAGAVEWAAERGLDDRDVFEQLGTNRRESYPVVDRVPRDAPVPPLSDPPAGARTIEAVYERPYQMHASLGPSAALAEMRDGRLRVWSHGQGPYPLRAVIAEVLGLDPASVRVTHAPGPGCYGHNGSDDAAVEAALVARAIPGRPVLLKWSREDEHAWEPYGPCMRVALRASLDADGRVVEWSHETFSDTHVMRPRPGGTTPQAGRLATPRLLAEPAAQAPRSANMTENGGIHRNATPPYAFPATRVVKHLVHDLPLRTGALRTLGAYANTLAAESFMDELALAAGADPLDFRLRHLDDDRTRAVLEAAAGRFGWRDRPRGGNGTGCGIAVARYKGMKSYCAVAMEVAVDDAARVRMRRAVAAIDAGEIVDRDGLEAQVEGGLLQAASWTLHEAVGFDRDGVTTRDWESYPILRFDEVPETEVVAIDRPGEPFLGAGEASCGPAGAAIANALADATGLRVRRLPFAPDAIRRAALDA